jgi:hypothetical protein
MLRVNNHSRIACAHVCNVRFDAGAVIQILLNLNAREQKRRDKFATVNNLMSEIHVRAHTQPLRWCSIQIASISCMYICRCAYICDTGTRLAQESICLVHHCGAQ